MSYYVRPPGAASRRCRRGVAQQLHTQLKLIGSSSYCIHPVCRLNSFVCVCVPGREGLDGYGRRDPTVTSCPRLVSCMSLLIHLRTSFTGTLSAAPALDNLSQKQTLKKTTPTARRRGLSAADTERDAFTRIHTYAGTSPACPYAHVRAGCALDSSYM